MSSGPSKNLTAANLDLLRKVLTETGYTGELLAEGPTDVAAKSLIRLFQNGVRDPAVLKTELERRFGRPEKKVFLTSGLHRLAIRGISTTDPEYRHPVNRRTKSALEEEPNGLA
ncbi:hypothetical protein [Rhizobium sp. Root1220]|uniref:hypothetical protein n=1 Tax=Rhizobium sp. Root1220 TaxID=1736432 RepID=UPI00070048D8|nr:hypothetical protein [Rhizobium sp. Root1220]KQV79627.1 hypothetical protein ASC90_26290 [Rhizobium sp. Root1220]